MRHGKTLGWVATLIGLLAVAALAQGTSKLQGTVKDQNGKPWPGVTIVITNDATKAQSTVTTDARGQYSQPGLAPGNYTVDFKTPGFPINPIQMKIQPGTTITQDLDLKELLAKNPKYLEELKKQESAKTQFAQLKQHFEAGTKAAAQARALQAQLGSEPAAQQTQTQQQIAQLSQQAVSDFSQAEQIAGPKDSNLPTIIGNLANAYELAGNHAAAAEQYAKASALSPTDPALLQGAATNLAYAGKIAEASADCEKIAAIPQANSAACWGNIGVVLYNTNQLQAAVAPLQKATLADPKNADYWYLLGTALMNTMQSKMVNGKLTAVVAPGTVEAYQKYLDLAPNGPRAAEAKAALQVLQQLGAGVSTKYIAPKKH